MVKIIRPRKKVPNGSLIFLSVDRFVYAKWGTALFGTKNKPYKRFKTIIPSEEWSSYLPTKSKMKINAEWFDLEFFPALLIDDLLIDDDHRVYGEDMYSVFIFGQFVNVFHEDVFVSWLI